MKFVKTVNLDDVNPNTGNTYRSDLQSGELKLQRGNWVKSQNSPTISRFLSVSKDFVSTVDYKGNVFPTELFLLKCKVLKQSFNARPVDLSSSRQVIG